MVEIKRTVSAPASTFRALEEDRYRLVYSKSKVYVNPTAYARDNIPGFVALVKRVCAMLASSRLILENMQEAANPTYLLAWIPETLLNEKGTDEWDKFVKIEERAPLDDEDDGLSSLPPSYSAHCMPRCCSHRSTNTAPRVLCVLGSPDFHILSGAVSTILLVVAYGCIHLLTSIKLIPSRWIRWH